MATVCFTGAGKRCGTQTFTRDQWQSLAIRLGHTPHDHVAWNTDYLVASRHDTSKARAAVENGRTRVISYAEWEDVLSGIPVNFSGVADPSAAQTLARAELQRMREENARRLRQNTQALPVVNKRELADRLAGMDDTPPEPAADRWNRVRKINI